MVLQVDLTAHQQELIETLAAEGVYQNAFEAIADGLRRVQEEREATASKLEALRSAVQAGFDDVDAGNSVVLRTKKDRDSFWAGIDREVSERVGGRAS